MSVHLLHIESISGDVFVAAVAMICLLGVAVQQIALEIFIKAEQKKFRRQRLNYENIRQMTTQASIRYALLQKMSRAAESRPIQLYANTLRRIFPDTVDQVVRWLQSSENGSRYSPKQLRGFYGLFVLVITAFCAVLGAPVSVTGTFAGSVLGFLAGLLSPNILAKKARRRMRAECTFELPEAIEMINLSIEAGMSFDQAVNAYAGEFNGQIATRLAQAVQMWSIGEFSRVQALEAVAHSLKVDGFTRFVAAVRQSLELGSMLRVVLDEQAHQAREEKRIQLEKTISKAPVKMLIPMAVCILPAMLMLVLGPIILQVALGMGGV